MKKSDAVKRIKEIHNRIFTVQMIEAFEEDELYDMFLERIEIELKMQPVSERGGFTGTAVVYDWEENITEADWSRAFDKVGRD